MRLCHLYAASGSLRSSFCYTTSYKESLSTKLVRQTLLLFSLNSLFICLASHNHQLKWDMTVARRVLV